MSTVIDRFQMALDSQVGTVFVALLVILSLLAIAYAFLLIYQSRNDRLAFRYRAYYEKAERMMGGISFTGRHIADFFGRRTSVVLSDGQVGKCLIPPPQLFNEDQREAYVYFHDALKGREVSIVAPLLWVSDTLPYIAVEGGGYQSNGRPLLSIKNYLLGQKITVPEKERVLLELAQGIAQLHNHYSEVGGKLYHGFMLPRSILARADHMNRIEKMVLTESGVVFSLGAKALYHLIEGVRGGTSLIDRHSAKEVLEQLPFLAPEQKDGNRLEQVSPAVDYFSYGALAYYAFTQKIPADLSNLQWEAVPERWQPFLRSCLLDHPDSRPKDIMEIEDWLSDPELALTQQRSQEAPKAMLNKEELIAPLPEMVAKLQKMKLADPKPSSGGGNKKISAFLNSSYRAHKASRWDMAEKFLLEAKSLSPDNAEVQTRLAITYYEMGDLKKAEEYYALAKKCDPVVAKQFRNHIAFRV